MDSARDWPLENLRAIRSLIDRTAIYRRSMVPVLALTGGFGVVGAVAGALLDITEPLPFWAFWNAVAAVVIACDLAVVAAQAQRRGEQLWSPPARRVARALVPAFASGFLLGLGAVVGERWPVREVWPMAVVWLLLYGTGVKAASAFMPRELRLLGWILLGLGAAGLAATIGLEPPARWAHAALGLGFGLVHLGYAARLWSASAPEGEPHGP